MKTPVTGRRLGNLAGYTTSTTSWIMLALMSFFGFAGLCLDFARLSDAVAPDSET
jgi:uncharacterized membrane protein